MKLRFKHYYYKYNFKDLANFAFDLEESVVRLGIQWQWRVLVMFALLDVDNEAALKWF